MYNKELETLSQAVNALTKDGYKEDFRSDGKHIIGNYSKKTFSPDDLEIVEFYRFDGDTDPQDESVVFAIEAKDGTRGTLVMSYGANQGQDIELIKKIPGAK